MALSGSNPDAEMALTCGNIELDDAIAMAGKAMTKSLAAGLVSELLANPGCDVVQTLASGADILSRGRLECW